MQLALLELAPRPFPTVSHQLLALEACKLQRPGCAVEQGFATLTKFVPGLSGLELVACCKATVGEVMLRAAVHSLLADHCRLPLMSRPAASSPTDISPDVPSSDDGARGVDFTSGHSEQEMCTQGDSPCSGQALSSYLRWRAMRATRSWKSACSTTYLDEI